MEQQSTRLRNAGFATFFFSGICSIRAGVVVSLLQERYGFAYGMTGSLLSLLSIGNLLAGFLIGVLPLGWPPTSCPAWGWCCSPCWWHACRKNKGRRR